MSPLHSFVNRWSFLLWFWHPPCPDCRTSVQYPYCCCT